MSSPPIAVAGCIHDTYPMMATCTPIQTRTTVPAVNALVRAIRERTNTATAAMRNDPPTTTKRITLGTV